jgi:REP element-mobilizing transposase RayT
MIKRLLDYKRKSFLEIGELFFWTATINQWQKLLQPDPYKDIITQSLDYLTQAGKADVFGFVIMPNHLHLIWRTKALNGRETAQGSFLKYTAHEFRKRLYKEDPKQLETYRVAAANKSHEFWQRDSLAIHLDNQQIAFQKLDYIHKNPLAERWQLVQDPSDYKYSSAAFYERAKSDFLFLKDLREEF